MVWIVPQKSKSKTKSSVFSMYKQVEVDDFTGFVLQTRRIAADPGTMKSNHRVISNVRHPYYEVAYAETPDEIRTHWHYLKSHLPKLLPADLPVVEREQWIINHIASLADGKSDDLKKEDSDEDASVTRSYRGAEVQDDAEEIQADFNGPRRLDRLTQARQNSGEYFDKDQWVSHQLLLRVDDYTTPRKLNVFIGTWNLNGKKFSRDSCSNLNLWLLPSGTESADIYVIGFQEIVDLTPGNILVDVDACKPWEDAIGETLMRAPTKRYQRIASTHLVGLGLIVFVSKDIAGNIRGLSTSKVGVGFLGVGGNKGAVGVRFDMFGSSLCLVNSHLAAHVHDVTGRNADFLQICKKMVFNKEEELTRTDRVIRVISEELNEESKYQRKISDHDAIIWLGDLNYRLDLADLKKVYDRIALQDWTYLLTKDQLVLEKKASRCFKYFQEGQVTFGPTYKFRPGTNDYEQFDKKARCPAWCDRIQWVGSDLQQLWYRRTDELLVSDHKPVSALFRFQARVVVEQKKTQVIADLKKLPNAARVPTIELSCVNLAFPCLNFAQPVSRTVTITNSSEVCVQFSFDGRLIGTSRKRCPKWLEIVPQSGLIYPYKTQDVVFTINITTAEDIMTGKDPLDSSLILRLAGAADRLLQLKAKFANTSFGCSLEFLNNLAKPVSTYSTTELAQIQSETTQQLVIPKEVHSLLDFLSTNELNPNLFAGEVSQADIQTIAKALDSGVPLAKSRCPVATVAATLVDFVQNLRSPLLPNSIPVWEGEAMNLDSWCKMALLCLPPSNYQLFLYLVAFLREFIRSHKPDVDQLSTVWGRALTQSDPEGTFSGIQTRSPMQLTKQFLASPTLL